jgi:hypothetical protein
MRPIKLIKLLQSAVLVVIAFSLAFSWPGVALGQLNQSIMTSC